MPQARDTAVLDGQTQLAHRLIDDQLDALRVAAGINAALLPIFDELVAHLRALMAAPITQQREAHAVIREAKVLIEKAYRDMRERHEASLTEFGEIAALATARTVRSVLVPTATTHASPPVEVDAVLMAGATVAEWWQKQATATLASITREVRLNLANAAGSPALMARIFGHATSAGVLDAASRSVRQIVHTSTTAVASRSREDFYAANADIVHGLAWLATLDGRTCLYCAARDGREYSMAHHAIDHALSWDEGPGAAHFNCRCVALPLLTTARERHGAATTFLGTRASVDGQVAASTTFSKWLDGKSRAFQDEYFGPGRAELWRKGVLTLSELLDMRGRPLTLAALRAKVASG